MKLPRDISGHDLAKALRRRGYQITRQSGSHLRLSTTEGGTHHITIPAHASLRIGTLAAIINEVAGHFKLNREDIVKDLFS